MTIPVRVQAVIERPPAPPWIGELPFAERAEWWPGVLLAWRWLDRREGLWTALVRYHREGLTYEHWLSGELLDVGPAREEASSCGGV
ncbi:MAG: hypothetical protein IPO93_17170 [Actinobacteria bacterium]|nr:hypothetical protein [Actinomycetota bacterium]